MIVKAGIPFVWKMLTMLVPAFLLIVMRTLKFWISFDINIIFYINNF